MTGLIGNINAFDRDVESWNTYEERLEQFFLVNDLERDRKKAALLTLIGEKTYKLLRNLTAPQKPADKSYDELCGILRTHLCPKPLLIAERFRFHKRNQSIGENISEFIAALRNLAENCEFGTFLNDALRDRFVCGLRDEATQRKLLSTEDLSLQRALELALAMETAHKDAAELQLSTHSGAEVQRIEKSRPRSQTQKKSKKKPCNHCGKNNHNSEDCRLKNAECHICKEKGHIRSICPKKVQNICESDSDDSYLPNLEKVQVINSVRSKVGKITIRPSINGKTIPMEVDTGASVTLMSETEFRIHFGKRKLGKPESVLKTYSGDVIGQVGTIMVKVMYNGQSALKKLCVVEGDGPGLFGRDWLKDIKLDWDRILPVNSVTQVSHQVRLHSILEEHKSVFADGIGKVKGIKARITLKDDAQPKFCKARSVPYSIQPKIEKELDNLENQGIISKVNTSEWATPIVPIVKGNGDVRICGDFKVTVNQAIKVDKYPLPKIEDIFAKLSQGRMFSKLDLRQAYLQLECEEASKELLTINTSRGLYRYNRHFD